MKKIHRVSLSIIILFVISIILMVAFSPYGKGSLYENRFLHSSIEINATKKNAYEVLGNSNNARKWSVFVHHINTLNSDEITDGSVGSVRRCYQNENELGLQWDEQIIINEINKRRRLSIFNMVGFEMSAENLLTDQVYEDIDGGCKLTFTLFFDSTLLLLRILL